MKFMIKIGIVCAILLSVAPFSVAHAEDNSENNTSSAAPVPETVLPEPSAKDKSGATGVINEDFSLEEKTSLQNQLDTLAGINGLPAMELKARVDADQQHDFGAKNEMQVAQIYDSMVNALHEIGVPPLVADYRESENIEKAPIDGGGNSEAASSDSALGGAAEAK